MESGRYTGDGIVTVIDEADGVGASRWGLLKAYREQRDAWISLDYAEKVYLSMGDGCCLRRL